MRHAYSAILLLLLALPAWAQQITLPAEATGKPGDFIQIPATTAGTTVEWLVIDDGLKLFPVELLRDSKTAIVTASQPGRYRLLAWSAKGDVPTKAGLCVVTIAGTPVIAPPVAPVMPAPPLTPVPVSAGKLWLVVVEDSTQATASRGKLYSDGALLARLKSGGHSLRIIQRTTIGKDGKTPPNLVSFLKRAEGKSLPYLLIAGEDGKLLYEGPLPPTAPELIGTIGKAGG